MSKSFLTKVSSVALSVVASTTPLLAFAQLTANKGTIDSFLTQFLNLWYALLPWLVVAVAIYLVIVAIQFAFSGGDEEKRKAAQGRIIWGLVGVVLIFSMFGLVYFAANIFSPGATQLPPAPTING